MKIALYNWAPAYGDFDEGGGVNIYLRNILQEMVRQGHDVTVLSGGFFYDVFRNDVYLRENNLLPNSLESRGTSTYVDIINSRVIAPAFVMFHNIELCLHEEVTKMAVRKFLSHYGPFDVFHIQNFEGIPYSVMELKTEFPQTKFILSNHNYHSVCQQVNLWYNEASVCDDYYNGIACYSCVNFQMQFANFFATRGFVTQMNRKVSASDNQIFAHFIEQFKKVDASWFYHFRLNDKTFEKGCIDIHGANKFQYRREKAVELMNTHLDAILSVSKFTASVLQKIGLDPSKMQTSYIGTQQYKEVLPRKPRKSSETLNICFMGYTRRDKGFYFLVNALANMPIDLRGRISLTFAGKIDDQNALELLKSIQNVLAKLTVINQYKHSDLPNILADIDVGIVPPLWYDALPQVAIEFLCNGTPILVSDYGGQQEIIEHEDFVFAAGNTDDFWRKLRKIFYNQRAIEEFWDAGVHVFSNKQHVDELLRLYSSLN